MEDRPPVEPTKSLCVSVALMRLNRWRGENRCRPGSALSLVWCFFFRLACFIGAASALSGRGLWTWANGLARSHCPHHRSLRSKLYIIHQPSPGSSEHARIYSQKIISESKPFSPFPRSPASPPSSIIDIKLYFISKYDCHYPRPSPELEVSPRWLCTTTHAVVWGLANAIPNHASSLPDVMDTPAKTNSSPLFWK